MKLFFYIVVIQPFIKVFQIITPLPNLETQRSTFKKGKGLILINTYVAFYFRLILFHRLS